MGSIKVISTSTIQAPIDNNNHNSSDYQKIELTPWDLQFLHLETIQAGLLFHQQPIPIPNHINHLKQTLSSTLNFFPPLAGRLVITRDDEHNNATCSIICNNLGALFVHATVQNTTVVDILQSNYTPPIVHSFFPLNRVKNHEAVSQPTLGVQVTELSDGVFIGFTCNHVVADGKSFWHFVNSWSQISKGSHKISKLPSFQRWFPNDIEIPIHFPFTKTESQNQGSLEESLESKLAERIFHFTKEKIAELKSKANAEAGTEKTKITSFQALLSHVWRSVVRCKKPDPQEDVSYVLFIGVRPRLIPPLEEDYFGNAVVVTVVRMKAGEVLEYGIGKVALEINKMISLHSDKIISNHYESWLRTPKLFPSGSPPSGNSLAITCCPRFDVFGNDFGWGKPVAVRSGIGNKYNGKITVFAGAEEGSINVEFCLSYEILEALGNDTEFMDPCSTSKFYGK